jgi:hypothetical protein
MMACCRESKVGQRVPAAALPPRAAVCSGAAMLFQPRDELSIHRKQPLDCVVEDIDGGTTQGLLSI